MACMSSITSTVFPTPAPPKSPVLPPRTKGQRRSMTLMPVWSTSLGATVSMSGSGSPRMLRKAMGTRAGPPSKGSPKMLSTRPRQSGATGTWTGAPVS